MMWKIFCNLRIALIAIALFACSKKEEPTPDPDKDPQEETNPGTGSGNGTTNLVDYDAAYPLFEGKSGSASMLADGSVVIWGSTKSTTSSIFRVTKEGVFDPGLTIETDKSWLIKRAGSLAVLPDGKIILGGEFQINGKTYSVIRLTSSGALDNSFSPYNTISGSMTNENISKIFIQKDGKLIVISTGTIPNIAQGSFLTRLNANGTLDNKFPNLSNFIYSIDDKSRIIGAPTINDIIQQSDGKILIAGGLNFFNKRRYVARINLDGSLDETFNFKERMDMLGGNFGEALCLAEQNGKVLVGGYFDALVTEDQRDTKFNSLNLLRLNSDGSIDQSFKASSEKNAIISLIVRNDNSIVTLSNQKFNSTQIALYNSDGSIRGGYKIAEDKSVLVNMLKQANDKILIAGTIINTNGQTNALVRLTIK